MEDKSRRLVAVAALGAIAAATAPAAAQSKDQSKDQPNDPAGNGLRCTAWKPHLL